MSQHPTIDLTWDDIDDDILIEMSQMAENKIDEQKEVS
jgi:hypothetical protein